MSTPLPPLLDGLIGLTQSVIDNSSQRSWTEIEDLEKEQEQRPPAERIRQIAAGTATSSGAVSPASVSGPLAAAAQRLGSSTSGSPVLGDSVARTQMRETAASDRLRQRSSDHGTAFQAMAGGNVSVQSIGAPGPASAAISERMHALPVAGPFDRHVDEKPTASKGSAGPNPPVAGEGSPTPIAHNPIISADVSAAIADAPVMSSPDRAPSASTEGPMPAPLSSSARQETQTSNNPTNPTVMGVEHSLLTSGPVAAAQKLHSAIRAMSPEQVSVFLDSASALVASIFEKASQSGQGVEHGPKTDHQPKEVRTALAIAHIAAAMDRDPRSPSSMRLNQDIAALILSPSAPNDNAVFGGLAQAIGVGAGAKLALIVAFELAHQRDGRSRARSLLALMLSGFARLGERIDEAYADILRHAGPLCIEWMKWRQAGDGADAIAALIEHLHSEPLLLQELEPRLEKLEQTGLEAFRAIRDLSGYSFSPELRTVHQGLLNSDSAFAAIASSRSALKEIRHTALATADGGNGVTIDAVLLMLTRIGFDAPRAEFLVSVSELGRSTMLGATWTALDSFPEMEASGRSFQRLLAFLNGQYVVAVEPEIVSFDSADMQPE
jgi:hypothetical protein